MDATGSDAIQDEIAATVPADMPNAEHKDGDVQLNYDFQTFNQLVAANTALQTEVSGANERAKILQDQILSLNDTATDLRIERGQLVNAHREQIKERDNEISALTEDRDYFRGKSEELQRKLDRQSGYLDAVFDREDGFDAAKTQTVPVAPPMVGPDFSDIPTVQRRSRSTDNDGFLREVSISSIRPGWGFAPTHRTRRN